MTLIVERIPNSVRLEVWNVLLYVEDVGDLVKIPLLVSLNQQIGVIIDLTLNVLPTTLMLSPSYKNQKIGPRELKRRR